LRVRLAAAPAPVPSPSALPESAPRPASGDHPAGLFAATPDKDCEPSGAPLVSQRTQAPKAWRPSLACTDTTGPGPGLVARVLWLYCMRLASSGVGGVRRVRLAFGRHPMHPPTPDDASRTRRTPPTPDDASRMQYSHKTRATSPGPGPVGRLLEQTPILVVVREFLRMFASEAKQRRNTDQDSSRTVLAMNLGTGHTTYKRAGARRAPAMR